MENLQFTTGDSFNGFGVPVHVPGFFALAEEIGHTFTDGSNVQIGDVMTEAAYRLMLAEATGRWRWQTGRTEPTAFIPGDTLALSAGYAMGLAGDRVEQDGRPAPVLRSESSSIARMILDARNYWLPRGAVGALLASTLPAAALADLTLPAAVCALWFAQPVEIPGGAAPAMLLESARVLDEFAQSPGQPYIERPLAATMNTMRNVHEGGSAILEGVILFADPDGQPRDHIGWLVRDTKAKNRMIERNLLLGRRSDAAWRSAIDLATAIVAWGDWSEPERFTPDVGWDADRAAKRQLRKGRAKRLEEGGGLTNVVVLDTRRRAPARGDGTGSHASPITHTRRDHFRRVLVGPRDAPRREWRWIPPTIVNPDGTGAEFVRVYRLPRPPQS